MGGFPGCRWFPVGLAACLALGSLLSFAADAPAPGPVSHPALKSASEAAAADDSLVLLVFSADWCAPCKELKKTLSSPEFLQQGGALHLATVDVDADSATARDFAVQAIPTLVLLTPDGKIVARQEGFVHTAELLPWLEEGRRRAKAGQWEGTVPGAKFEAFAGKAAAGSLTTNDLQRLVEMLGEPAPADRASAASVLLAQREAAVPLLIEAAGHPYLGTRIGAVELLQRLAPEAVSLDPWQSPGEASNRLAALRRWWASTGKLPSPAASRPADPSLEGSIRSALDDLRSQNPQPRTQAMADLAACGTAALPAIREALRRAERSGDQRLISLLEDVRWKILVPDPLETRVGGVRQALARGKTQERQQAVERLGKGGREALGALTELAHDPDPLVVESTIRALASMGDSNVLPAMAALLQSGDSNLRMTAAQALGHTRKTDALQPLLSVLDDPNEVVACTALSAVEEIRSRSSSSSARAALPENLVAALRRCLADPRWRVRAAAVEVAGKLAAKSLADDLKKLLEDPDGFVVKNTLAALGRMGQLPDPERLLDIARRLPSLRTDVVEALCEAGPDDNMTAITGLISASSAADQVTILQRLAEHGGFGEGRTDAAWKPLLARATTAPDPRVRRAGTELLGKQSLELARELVGPLLADEDGETRAAAAGVIVSILARDSGLSIEDRSERSKTNRSQVTAEQTAAWHSAMVRHAGPDPGLLPAAAIYCTGDGKADLPLLLAPLEKADLIAFRSDPSALMGLILSRLPWPEGKPLLEQLAHRPSLYAAAARETSRVPPAVADFLLDPARFRSAVESADGEELMLTLGCVAGFSYGEQRLWSLWSGADRTRRLALALVESTNAAWRAAGIFSLGCQQNDAVVQAAIGKALEDRDAWVRAAAVQATSRHVKNRAALEQWLGPGLTDTNSRVAIVAASALLEPEIRRAAGLDDFLTNFQYEQHRGAKGESYGTSVDRPLTTLDYRPALLAPARARLKSAEEEELAAFVLLLAQYGEFEGVDRLAAQPAEMGFAPQSIPANSLLAGIALTRDAKYVPVLRQLSGSMKEEWELRKVLQALKGMTGPEARQLRLEINKQMRNPGGS